MRRSILTFAFALIFAALAATAWAGPKATFDSTKFDFGDVRSGRSVSHVFVLRNTGDEILKIQKVEAP